MIVLDASALVDVVADRPPKRWVLEQLDGEHVLAPGHQLAEVLSAVARLARAGDLTGDAARDAVAEACRLPQEVRPLDAGLIVRALALGERIRVLDGLYVALAEASGAALVTTDERLAAADPPCTVRSYR